MGAKRTLSNGSELDAKRLAAEESSDLEAYISDESAPVFDIARATSNKWQETIPKVVNSVVSIQFAHVSNFDTDASVVSEATGFVVDIKRGLILTNRHVVGTGPFTGYVVFDNHEEAVVKPIYRDPLHDFGFLQFDPQCIKYLQLTQLELKPEMAKVGTEIRVVGNDAGEKLSILAGFISRLDRNAPDYGVLTYNDFNTEYIQAAASASGGSSGSPVVNEDGHAVALQAGGSTEASTDFFLPVYRPLRALKCIQNNQPITRGDIQVEWQLKPFEECRRLGLTPDAEKRARELFPNKIGLLVAELVLPEGPADNLIKEGDTLISINGEHISTFIRVDEILDENVGNDLEFVIQRGGKEIKHKITIGDLHAITPDRYVEVAGALFNNVSYQVARCFCIPMKGVYINDASGSFEEFDKCGWIIETVDDRPTPNLDAFIEIMKTIPDREKITIAYRHVTDLNNGVIHVVYVERHWQSTFRMAVRDDSTGLWNFTDLQDKALPPVQLQPQNAKFIDLPWSGLEKEGCAGLVRSFVQVRTFAPIPVDSFPFKKEISYGVLIDATNGYVLVSRRFVPHDMCDVSVIFAESVEVPASVVFLHPTQNYAIVRYDPKLVLADVRTPKFSSTPLKRGDKANFIGYNYNLRLVTDDVKVSSISSLNIPSGAIYPRYRGTNLECILLDNKLCQECDTGILADNDGTVRSFWLTYLGETTCDQNDKMYRMGLDVTDVLQVIELLKENKVPNKLRILDAEFHPMIVLGGKIRGVPQDWINMFEAACDDEVKFLSVTRVAAPASGCKKNPLKTGDIVLSVDGSLVKSTRDLNVVNNKDLVTFKVVRHKKVLDIVVPTLDTTSIETTHVVFWAGAVIQAPHFAVRQLMETIPSGVYVTRKSEGGPANQYGISRNSFITHVNDIETQDLDTFVKVVKDIPDNTYIKLRLVSFDNVPVAISLKTNYHYFPTGELKKQLSGEWKETEFHK